MRLSPLLVASAIVLGIGPLPAQSNGTLPPWVDDALSQSGFWQRYELTSRASPEVEYGDLNDDGLLDAVIAIVDNGGRRRGLAIVHQIDRSVYIIGAGQPVGDGSVELPHSAGWGIGRLLDHHSGIRVALAHAEGWLVWNGHSYAWVPDST